MTDTTVPAPSVPEKGLAARFFGVLLAPAETFRAVAAKPTWLVMALIVIVLTGGSQLWFQSTDVGRQAMLDESVRQLDAYGIKVSDQMYEQVRKGIMEPSMARQVGSVSMLVILPVVLWVVVAGLAMLVFGAWMDGRATFTQALAVAVYSSVIWVVGAVIMTPVNYFRESLSSATNLGVFLPFLPEGSFLARLFGMMDVFRMWWVAVLAIGFAGAFKKKTRTVALILFGIYAVFAVAFAAFMAMRSSS
jgi:hypothetical protein